MRASILVRSRTTAILVDTGPDMRAQLLAADAGALDAVVWTHEHADHTNGIDDLRQVYHLRGKPVPGYARKTTLDLLGSRFGYVFHGRGGYPPTCDPVPLDDRTSIGDIVMSAVDQPHGSIRSMGLRFEQDGRSIGYATDCSSITADMIGFFHGVDIWIVDALRREPHPTHTHVAAVLEAMPHVGARRTILTHMDQSMDYATVAADLAPYGIEPGMDGLDIHL